MVGQNPGLQFPIPSYPAVSLPLRLTSLSPHYKPIATKSHHFTREDKFFIDKEMTRLLSESIIEGSNSPWRAEVVLVVVVKGPLEKHKKLCVDYSQTKNLYTNLDAYPLSRIGDMVNSLAHCAVFSTFDLKSAYHQLPFKGIGKERYWFRGQWVSLSIL